MKKQAVKTSVSGNSYSCINSDVSKAIYKQQSLTRKLRHIRQQNVCLEQKIKLKEQQIKDQRTMIIYQMGQLGKTIGSKIINFQDYKISKEMIKNQEQAHKILEDLMGKFQNIQKQQRLITKVKNNIEKMYRTYVQHKQSIQSIMKQSSCCHNENEQKIKKLIQQKKNQLGQVIDGNHKLQERIYQMKQQMEQFQKQSEQLDIEQQQLLAQITQQQESILKKVKIFEQLNKYTEMVVDKKYRQELFHAIKLKNKQLNHIQLANRDISVACLQEQHKLAHFR